MEVWEPDLAVNMSVAWISAGHFLALGDVRVGQ